MKENDTISRQAAIDVCFRDEVETGYDAANLIAQLPTAEPRKWVLVSERLPEEGEGVLWCTRGGYVCSGCVLLGRPIDDCGHQGNYIAWMPLPEPFRDGEGDG